MMENDRPNILVIMSDQHNRAFLGCAGHEYIRTPNLDRLAEQGIRMTHAYCNSPLCSPSRMSFLTGQLPSSNRVWSNGQVFSSAIPTFAHALGAAGYETALIGRMDIRGPDQHHGFEHRPWGEFNARHPGAPRLGCGTDCIPSVAHSQFRPGLDYVGRGEYYNHWYDTRVTEHACNYLKTHEKSKRPFAAVVGFILPHCPFFATPELFDYYHARVDGSQPSSEENANQPASIQRFRKIRGLLDPIPNAKVRAARAAYLGLVEFMDRQVGRILNCLDESRLTQSTLVVYVSDHGEQAGEHGCWWKSSYYEGSVGIPMIARLPGIIPKGSKCDALCSLVDLGPSLLELAEAQPIANVSGRSLAPLWRGERTVTHDNAVFAELMDQAKTGEPASAMVRNGPWKLWKYDDDLPPALFNLVEDPREMVDLGESPGHVEVRDHLLSLLYQQWNPVLVRAEYERQQADLNILRAWGKAVAPELPETVPDPPKEFTQVEIVAE